MSNLLGVWSKHRRSLKTLVGVERVQAMRSLLADPSGELVDFDQGTFCIIAGRDKLIAGDMACSAYEGFIPEGEFRAGEPSLAPEGHYSLVHADACSLTLLRALSGGERLYYFERDGVVIFSSTLRALLAYPGVARRLDRHKARDAVLAGVLYSGDTTLIDGVAEVPAGHIVRFDGTRTSRRWAFGGLLTPREGDPETLAAEYREALARAIVACAGRVRPVALSLSGGIDSAAVAALAVEAFGADSVEAFTYEFDDPTHPIETPYAVEVCGKLGIRHHRVFRISFDGFLAAIPETVWRAESFAHWPKAFMLLATRYIRDAGHDRYLCGFGIGSHMAYFEELARLLSWVPASTLSAYWELAHTRRFRWLERLESLHPALAVPNVRLLRFLSSLLRSGPDEQFRGMALGDQIRHQSFAHLLSCVDVTRWEKPLREIGVYRLSPAHFASTLPYAYLPYHPRPFVWSRERRLRPGKHLLAIAMRGRIPDSVIYRKKSWEDAVISRRWLAAGRYWMRQAGADQRLVLEPGSVCDARSPQHALTALAFWHKLFIDRAPSLRPPAWEALATS